MYYAQIDSNNICIGISQLKGDVNNPNMIKIGSYDKSLLGKIYDNGNWVEQKTPALDLIVNSITSDDPNAVIDQTNNEITLKENYSITADVEIQSDGSVATTFTGTFRMPIKAEDGDTRFALVGITDGVGSVTIPFSASGLWEITQEDINAKLPDEQKMNFSGMKIYVVL